MDRCLICDSVINWDGSKKYCLRHFAEQEFNQLTGLSLGDLPDELPLEDYINEDGELDFEGIIAW